jgi:hypothetical protein
MGVIRTIIGILLIVVLVVVGYWMYVTYTTKNGDDEIWATINRTMPEPLREWACNEIRQRESDIPAPRTCRKFWPSVTPQPDTGPDTGIEPVQPPPGG